MDLTRDPFRLGLWTVYPAQDRLERDGESMRIEPRAMEVLVYLAQNEGEVVSSDELIEAGWGQTHQGENPIYRCIWILRNVLEDNPRTPNYIKTVPTKGYRLVCAVQPLETAPLEIPEVNRTVSGKHRRYAVVSMIVLGLLATVILVQVFGEPQSARQSLAVLPFQNSTGDGENDYLAYGIADDVRLDLNRVKTLAVAEAVVSNSYQDNSVLLHNIGQNLGVKHILRGSISETGGLIEISASLIDVENERALWSDTERYDTTDIANIHVEITTAVTEALEVIPELNVSSNGLDDGAYLAYLRGLKYLRDSRGTDKLKQAVKEFEYALKLEPSSARANAGLCKAYLRLYVTSGRDTDYFEKAEKSCNRTKTLDRGFLGTPIALGILYREFGDTVQAQIYLNQVLELDPLNIEAMIELGETLAVANKKQLAEHTFKQAIELQPGYWTAQSAFGNFLFKQKKYVQAREHFQEVTELTPNSGRAFSNLAASYQMLADLNAAVEAYQKSLTLEPSRMVYTNLGLLYYGQDRFTEAAEMQLKAIELAPKDYRLHGRLADAYMFIDGQQQNAKRAFSKAIELAENHLKLNPTDWLTLAYLGVFHASAGDPNRAETLIRRAHAQSPDNPDIFFLEALMWAAMGQNELVRIRLERALELGYPAGLITSDPYINLLSDDADVGPLLKRLNNTSIP